MNCSPSKARSDVSRFCLVFNLMIQLSLSYCICCADSTVATSPISDSLNCHLLSSDQQEGPLSATDDNSIERPSFPTVPYQQFLLRNLALRSLHNLLQGEVCWKRAFSTATRAPPNSPSASAVVLMCLLTPHVLANLSRASCAC